MRRQRSKRRWGFIFALPVMTLAIARCSSFSGTASNVGDAAPSSTSDAAIAQNDAAALDASFDAGTYANAVHADNPISYYRLDDDGGTAADFTGTAPGTYGANTTPGAPGLIFGDLDRATLFPFPDIGIADASYIINVPRNAALEPQAGLTVECWIRPVSFTTGGNIEELVSYGYDKSPGPYQQWVLQLRDDVAVAFAAGIYVSGKTVLIVGDTYHVVQTYDGSTKVLTLYVNGVRDAYSTPVEDAGYYYDTVHGLGIGGGIYGVSTFNGVIDEVAIYDHALTAAQVQHHYFLGTPTQ